MQPEIRKIVIPKTPRPSQQAFLQAADREDLYKLVGYIGGRQTGKTLSGSLASIMKAQRKGKGVGMVVTPTYAQSDRAYRSVEEILSIDRQFFDDLVVTRTNPYPTIKVGDFTLQFRSADKPNNLRSETLDFIWIDEAGFISQEAWRILLPAAAIHKAQIMWTTTPPTIPLALSWLYNDVYLPWEKGDAKDSFIVKASAKEVYSPEEFTRILTLYGGPDSAYAKTELFGDFAELKGRVFPNFNPDRHTYHEDSSDAPSRFEWVTAGMDFGFNDPHVFLVIGYANKRLWVMDEFYQSGLSNTEAVAFTKPLYERYDVRRVWADNARPDSIKEFNMQGIPTLPVVKRAGSVTEGIKMIYGLLALNRIKVNLKCHNLIDELYKYAWKKSTNLAFAEGSQDELKTTSRAREEPIDLYNHCIDALRYTLLGEYANWAEGPEFGGSKRYKESDDWDLDDEDELNGRSKYIYAPH